MYYHVQLDPLFHDERSDMNAQIEWDFRSLEKALMLIGREFGPGAAYWKIHYGPSASESAQDVMHFEQELRDSLETDFQYLFMMCKDSIPQQKTYVGFNFRLAKRDETTVPASFSFSEEDEDAIQLSIPSDYLLIDLFKCPIDATRIDSMTACCDDVRNVFTGVRITLKGGGSILVSYGVNSKGKVQCFRSPHDGIEKNLIVSIQPWFIKESILCGFYMPLTTGDRWCLPIGKPLEASIFNLFQLRGENAP